LWYFYLAAPREGFPPELEFRMATLQQQITDKFLAKLSESKHVDADLIEHLRSVLSDTKRLRGDDLAKIFSLAGVGDPK
jgi:hypothetical protein